MVSPFTMILLLLLMAAALLPPPQFASLNRLMVANGGSLILSAYSVTWFPLSGLQHHEFSHRQRLMQLRTQAATSLMAQYTYIHALPTSRYIQSGGINTMFRIKLIQAVSFESRDSPTAEILEQGVAS